MRDAALFESSPSCYDFAVDAQSGRNHSWTEVIWHLVRRKDHEGTVQKIAAHCGFTPTAEQWPKVMEYTSFKWMKEHSVAFEAANLAPVPVMAEGTMIRKGESGAPF